MKKIPKSIDIRDLVWYNLSDEQKKVAFRECLGGGFCAFSGKDLRKKRIKDEEREF